MSEIVAEGIIESDRLLDFAKTFTARAKGMKNPLVTECKMHFNDDGIRVSVVDAVGVAMINPATLDKRAFESYDAPGSVTIGVNLMRLIDYAKPADGSSLVSLKVDMETRDLRLEYGQTDLRMTLIDPESIRKEPDLPDLDLPNRVTLTGEQVDHALTVADLMSDHVDIVADADAETLSFRMSGDTDSGGVEYTAADLVDHEIAETTESRFSLEYLRCFAKPMPPHAEVTLELGQEFPVILNWGGIDGHFVVNEVLAPRIDSS